MRHKPAYQPASLVMGSSRWYIKVYAPQRMRLTFNLNRIHDLNLRRQRGEEITELINWWLASDLPMNTFDERVACKRRASAKQVNVAPRGHTAIVRALYHAVELKAVKTRKTSSDSYRSHANVFADYLEREELTAMPVDSLETYHIMDFLDYRQLVDKVSNTTINNNIIHLAAMFTELKVRGFVLENPWHGIEKLSKQQKQRRAFTLDEAKAAIRYFYEYDPLLCLAILLQYCCLLRPNEIRKLKVNDIDLDFGVVRVRPESGKTSKNINTRYATIPLSYEPYFRQLLPTGKGYIFGKGFCLANEPCSKGRMYKRHQKGIRILKGAGKIEETKGLVFYSWKDTGATFAAHRMDIIFVRDQAGHTNTNTTLKYYEKPKLNTEFRKMENVLLE